MKLSDRDLEERYNDMLDGCYGTVAIGPYDYSTSDALKSADPIAYREGFNNWLDSELGETVFEFDGEYYSEDPTEGEA